MRPRLTWIMHCALLAGCAGTTHSPQEPARKTESNAWREQPANPACQAQLLAFRDGRLDVWKGLQDCRRVDVEAVFGDGEPGSPDSRYYRAQGVAHGGILAWFDERGAATMILATRVELPQTVDAILGRPELERPSPAVEGARDWIHAARGLSFQVAATDYAFSVMGFAAMKLEDFLASPVSAL